MSLSIFAGNEDYNEQIDESLIGKYIFINPLISELNRGIETFPLIILCKKCPLCSSVQPRWFPSPFSRPSLARRFAVWPVCLCTLMQKFLREHALTLSSHARSYAQQAYCRRRLNGILLYDSPFSSHFAILRDIH